MIYSYTQVSQYLTCPRRYRHRYLDGWQEKDTRANLLFGRVFELALAALFRREDPGAVLFREWSAYQHSDLNYSGNGTWNLLLQQGIQLLERFVQDDRVRIRQPRLNLQIKFKRPLPNGNDLDRKSTRLNSSHEWISYAVFCLKKKKTILTHRVNIMMR